MYALTGSTGSVVWSFNDGGDALFSIVNTAAIFSGGSLLFGSLNKKFYCLDSKGGGKKWSYTAGGAWKSYAAVSSSSGTVYAANLDGYLYSLTSAGSLLWKTKLTGATMMAPVSMAGDTILYFSNMAISASSGTVLWTLSELEPTAGNLTYAAAAVSKDGTVYMGTESGAVYALGGAPVPDPDTKFMEDLTAAVLASFKDWTYTAGNTVSTLPSSVSFFNSLDFSKMPDGVTYRKNVCPHAADYTSDYALFDMTNGCNRQITVKCNNGKISLLRLRYLHESMDCSANQGSYGSNFYLRGLKVPSSIGGLSGLTHLDLWGTDLIHLPTELGNLPRLRQLRLGSSSSADATDFGYNRGRQPSDNIVWSIPTEIGKLTTLWQLAIGSTVELPTHIGQLAGLAELRIDRVGKTVSGIPSELGNLMSLTQLTVTTSSFPWAQSFNPLIRNKCLPASLVSRLDRDLLKTGDPQFSPAATATSLAPFLAPACLTVPYPSPPPSSAPSSPASPFPTMAEPPTPRMRSYLGTGLFVSKHVDQECKFQPYGVQYPFVSSAGTALKLSTCLPLPSSSSAGAETTFYTLTCKVGARKYSIEESVFSSSSCSGAPISKSTYKHDKVCRWDPANGGFLKIHCGDDEGLPRSSKRVVLGRHSTSKNCERENVPSNAASNATYWLDVCSPNYAANSLRGPSLAYNFMLSLDTSSGGAAAGLRVIEARYDPSDVLCARGPLSQKSVFFPNGPASGSPCVKDPLNDGRYYQISPGVNPLVLAAVQSSAPTAFPTRAVPTPAPSSTSKPTSSIWSKSFASNFTSTSCLGSQYVTSLPFCTGSLGSFWTVTWQNVGINSVVAPTAPYPIYATTRTGSSQPYAVMLYGGLRLTSQPSALANVKGVVYSIEFDVVPAAGTAHSTPYHFTRSEDFVLVSVVRKSDGSPLNPTGGFKFYPSNFQDVKYDNVDGRRDYSNNLYRLASQCSALGCVWYRAAFQYVGDGTGPVSLRFSCGCDLSGGAPEFCGSIDNIAIIHLGINSPSPKPTPAPSFQALGSPKTPPLYLVINNEWGSNYGLGLFGGRELQFWNGNTLITGLKARCGAWASDETEDTLAARYNVSFSPWPFKLKTWPGYLTDGDLTTSMQLDAKKNKLLSVIYVDVTGVQFDRIVFFPLQDNWPTLTNLYTEDTNWGGSRIALVNSPDSPPIWQSSFPANTLMSKAYGGSGPPVSFTFYPFSSQLKCNAGSCIGRLNSTSSFYCFGSVGGTCPSTDCTIDIDCVKKYNLDASKPKILWLGA